MTNSVTLDPKQINIDTVDLRILMLIDENLTYAEMATRLGYSAKSGIHRRVNSLVEKGLITKEPLKSRSRRLTDEGRETLDGFIALARKEQADGSKPIDEGDLPLTGDVPAH
jgi:DNA-binding MarR family transcriptional regulator